MSSLPALTAISNGTAADATEVDGNFDTLATFVDNELVNRDGTVAMTAELTLSSSTPSGGLVAASKGYVDGVSPTVNTAQFVRATNVSAGGSSSGTISFETESNDTDGWWSSGSTFTCPANGIYIIQATLYKSSVNGQLTAEIDGSWNESTYSVSATGSSAAGYSHVFMVGVIMSGQTFQIDWTNGSVSSGTIDWVRCSITKLATF